MDLTKANFINSSKYLPPKLRENSKFEKICDLIDSLVSDSSIYFTYERKQLSAVINKYRDQRSLDNTTIHQIVKEFGYQYIIDIMELPDSRLKDLVAFLALINILKGSRKGLELVLSLLGFEFTLVEWWEDPVLLPTKCTYALELDFVDIGVNPVPFTYRFDEFSREYVYPLLVRLLTKMKLTYGQYYTGAAGGYHPRVKIFPKLNDDSGSTDNND